MSGAVTEVLRIGSTTYTLTFNFRTMREAERALGTSVLGQMSPDGGVSLETLGVIFWAALQAQHPSTMEEAEDLLDLDGAAKALNRIAAGIAAYFGAAEETEGDGVPNPPKAGRAKGGTGSAS